MTHKIKTLYFLTTTLWMLQQAVRCGATALHEQTQLARVCVGECWGGRGYCPRPGQQQHHRRASVLHMLYCQQPL
jgi:hypothetical protein